MNFSWVRKALRSNPPAGRLAPLWAGPVGQAGWWRDDPTEQLRQYQSWVYAAVNAIA